MHCVVLKMYVAMKCTGIIFIDITLGYPLLTLLIRELILQATLDAIKK